MTIIGPRDQLETVRIIIPTRMDNQIKIPRSNEYCLDVHALIRASSAITGVKLAGTNCLGLRLKT